MSSNHRKGKGDVGKPTSDIRKLRKNHCVFCKEEGYWKIDCLRLKKEMGQRSKANFHKQMIILILTLQYFLLLEFVVQRNLSGF